MTKETQWIDGINGPAMDKFMEDLRSGKFKQTKGQLFDNYGMCCLGVATEGTYEELGYIKDVVVKYYEKDGCKFGGLMPVEIADHLGIPKSHQDDGRESATNVYLKSLESERGYAWKDDDNGNKLISATELNDTLGLTFAEIADRFEDTFLRKGDE